MLPVLGVGLATVMLSSGWVLPGADAPVGSVPASRIGAQNILTAVDATAEDDAWAVGNITDGHDWVGLLLHWDGTSWHRAPAPDLEMFLEDVVVIDHDDAWAVGREVDDGSGNSVLLVLHWDGVAWSQVSTGAVPLNARVASVSGTSSDDVWAVGYRLPQGAAQQRAFSMHWDGRSWRSVVVPKGPGWRQTELTGVVANAADDVWAVGSYQPDPVRHERTLAVHWDGTSWVQSVTRSPGYAHVATFNGVTTDASGTVWAVGSHETKPWAQNKPLVERWDGVTWRRVAVLGSGRYLQWLYDVSAVGDRVWAVGEKAHGGSDGWHALTTEWDGTGWVAHRSRSPGHEGSTYLLGVSMTPNGTGFAVGFFQTEAGPFAPFVERWDGHRWLRDTIPS